MRQSIRSLPYGFNATSYFQLHLLQKSLLFHHISGLIKAIFVIHFSPPFISRPSSSSQCCSQDSLQTCGQDAMWLLFCSASLLSTSACSLAIVLSFTALSRTLSSVFSFSRFSEVSASSCSRLTASPSCLLFSRCCSSKLCLSRCSSAFCASKLRVSNFSRRLSRHSCASCWERRSRAWCSAWTSCWSARNSVRKIALGPGPFASLEATGLSACCTEPECCRMNWRRLGSVMGRSSGNFTLECFLEEKQKQGKW